MLETFFFLFHCGFNHTTNFFREEMMMKQLLNLCSGANREHYALFQQIILVTWELRSQTRELRCVPLFH